MITQRKVKQYWTNKGSLDSFQLQYVRHDKNVLSEEEFCMIDNFVQKYSMVLKGLTSKDFEINLENLLKGSCEDDHTVNLIKKYTILELNDKL